MVGALWASACTDIHTHSDSVCLNKKKTRVLAQGKRMGNRTNEFNWIHEASSVGCLGMAATIPSHYLCVWSVEDMVDLDQAPSMCVCLCFETRLDQLPTIPPPFPPNPLDFERSGCLYVSAQIRLNAIQSGARTYGDNTHQRASNARL